MNQDSFARAAAAVFEESARQQRATKEVLTAISATIRHFQAQTDALPHQVLKSVDQALPAAAGKAASSIASKWTDANKHADKATKAYQEALRWSPWKIAGMAMFCTLCGIFGMVVTARSVLPQADVVAALRIEEANLRQKIQQLTGNGGFANVVICYDTRNRKRLCVQIDESARVPNKGYRVIKGY